MSQNRSTLALTSPNDKPLERSVAGLADQVPDRIDLQEIRFGEPGLRPLAEGIRLPMGFLVETESHRNHRDQGDPKKTLPSAFSEFRFLVDHYRNFSETSVALSYGTIRVLLHKYT
ncbi:MAG TPA: hypothetical protein ENH05_01595 [Rhizobiales bacterium]|nr:hypothetical protein [Hyphomicrobiales bacterium]